MKKPIQFFLLLLVVAVVAVGSCLLTRVIMPTMNHSGPEDAHTWIHEQLGITAAQEKTLEPIEHRYAERRDQLVQAIKQANAELAAVMQEDKAASPRVNAAIEKIHAAQGELQMVTIAHVFEMKSALTSEQGDKLLRLTADALKSQNVNSH